MHRPKIWEVLIPDVSDMTLAIKLDSMLENDELDTTVDVLGQISLREYVTTDRYGYRRSIHSAVFILYLTTLERLSTEHPRMSLVNSDVYRELSDFLDNSPDDELGDMIDIEESKRSVNVLQYYFLESIKNRRMSKERVYAIIHKYADDGSFVTFELTAILIASYSAGLLTRKEIESIPLSDDHEDVYYTVIGIINEEEISMVEIGVLLQYLFFYVSILSEERTLRLAEYCHKLTTCEELLRIMMVREYSFPISYALFTERAVIITCDKPLTEYETTNEVLRDRIDYLIYMMDQV